MSACQGWLNKDPGQYADPEVCRRATDGDL